MALETLRRAEEATVAVGGRGAGGARRTTADGGRRTRLRPDVAIAIDVTYATDVPGDDRRRAVDHRLGGGPALFRGPAVNPRVFELLVGRRARTASTHTVEAGTRTYTDADDTFTSRAGIPTGLVSIPLRNMHSAIEIVQLERPRGLHPRC